MAPAPVGCRNAGSPSPLSPAPRRAALRCGMLLLLAALLSCRLNPAPGCERTAVLLRCCCCAVRQRTPQCGWLAPLWLAGQLVCVVCVLTRPAALLACGLVEPCDHLVLPLLAVLADAGDLVVRHFDPLALQRNGMQAGGRQQAGTRAGGRRWHRLPLPARWRRLRAARCAPVPESHADGLGQGKDVRRGRQHAMQGEHVGLAGRPAACAARRWLQHRCLTRLQGARTAGRSAAAAGQSAWWPPLSLAAAHTSHTPAGLRKETVRGVGRQFRECAAARLASGSRAPYACPPFPLSAQAHFF